MFEPKLPMFEPKLPMFEPKLPMFEPNIYIYIQGQTFAYLKTSSHIGLTVKK